MSHVVSIKTKLTDLEAVKKVCRELGLQFMENQKHYEWYGSSVGDYPLPAGFTKDDLGKCEHAIKVPGAGYEIGLARCKVGTGYEMLFDFWGPGKKILEALGGEQAPKFLQSYAVNKSELEMKRRGFETRRQVGKNGSVNVVVTSGRW